MPPKQDAAVIVVDITDPACTGEGVELIDLIAIKPQSISMTCWKIASSLWARPRL